MCKILFVYPNRGGYPVIPIAISLLSGILKQNGHEVGLFDTTFLVPNRIDHATREKAGFVQHVDVETHWGPGGAVDIDDEFRKKIQSFNPDLIAFSIVENSYGCARNLFGAAKETKNVPILVGGIFPTMAPEFFIKDENVDLICIGEGEYAIMEIAKRVDCLGNFLSIPNLIAKSVNGISRGAFAPYYRWDPLIFQDWEIFDQRHLFKPFMGQMRKTGYFELSRGCPYSCSFCNNPAQQRLFKELGKYNREKPIGSLISEVSCLKNGYGLNLMFFNDENFLQMNEGRLRKFCKEYEAIGLPFFIQTRADTLLNEERVKMLKDAGCITIGIGIEHGNEKFRREVLKKNLSNQVYETAFANCNRVGIRTTADVMIGLPFETEDMILETADFCRKVKTSSITLSIFAPYHGTELRRVCIKHGFMEDTYYDDVSMRQSSILTMPQISKERIMELYYGFNNLIFGNTTK